MTILRHQRKLKKDEELDLFNYADGSTLEEIKEADKAMEFILAGKAKITLKSHKTGKHYTFKIRRGDGENWFVTRLSFKSTYRYLGTIFPNGFRATKKSEQIHKKWLQESFDAFKWFWEEVNANKAIPYGVSIFHAGRCGMCGLELTDPVSIKEGYGPDCRKKRLRHNFMCDS